MHKYHSVDKKKRPTSEWDIFIWCTVVQNRPKVVDIYSSSHFYTSSGYLPRAHWLWLYNIIPWERREQAFLADDEWSGSSRCFYTSKWDGIATRYYPLQVENCICTLCSRNDPRVNDAHLQTILSKMQKRTRIVVTCEEICASLHSTMSGRDEQNSSESIMAQLYMEICPRCINVSQPARKIGQ